MDLSTWANDRYTSGMASHEELRPVYEQWLNGRKDTADAWIEFLREMQ